MDAPDGFSWVDKPLLAGMSRPESAAEFHWLRQQGIQLLISLSEDPPRHDWINEAGLFLVHVPVDDFTAPTPDQLEQCIATIERAHEKNWGVGASTAAPASAAPAPCWRATSWPRTCRPPTPWHGFAACVRVRSRTKIRKTPSSSSPAAVVARRVLQATRSDVGCHDFIVSTRLGPAPDAAVIDGRYCDAGSREVDFKRRRCLARRRSMATLDPPKQVSNPLSLSTGTNSLTESDKQLDDWNTYYQLLLTGQLSQYGGKFVVVHNGKVVAQGCDLDELRGNTAKLLGIAGSQSGDPFC